MKYLKYIFIMMVTSCGFATKSVEAVKKERDYFLARITYYSDDPRYGKKTASGAHATEGTTVAASRKIPFHTEYEIPALKKYIPTDGNFIVHDRGSAVDKRTASSGKLPVIDVYVSSYKKVKSLGKLNDNIFKVYYK